ncbi:MAG TPA: glycerophosphodiester phosphodiesterase family protein [bacterium]
MIPAALPAGLDHDGRSVSLKYHRLLSGLRAHPPNSLRGLHEIIAGGAQVIEFDVRALSGGDYVLLHDAHLDRESTGMGAAAGHTAATVKTLCHRGTDVPLTLLSEVTDVLHRYTGPPVKVQVDVKDTDPFSPADAERLLRAIAPLRDNARLRVVVGTLGDWNLRLFRRIDPTLQVGLDFFIYLDAPVIDELPRLPSRANVFGYLDDHPLGWVHSPWNVQTYLIDRITTLCGLVPGAVEVYLRKEFVARAVRHGVNPVEIVRRACGDVGVDVWTINADQPDAAALLAVALTAGATQITTDTAAQLPALVYPGARQAR